MSYPKIIDNNRKLLKDVLIEISKDYSQISIATGYWDLPGTSQIIDELSGYKKIRLLIGREPLIPRHQQEVVEPDFPDKDIFTDLEQLPATKIARETVKKIKKLQEQGILEVKIYKKSFLHAKCYIFGDYDTENAVGIIGSSNFTEAGLTKNAELNTLESDNRIVTFRPATEKQEVGHLYWFDQFWNSSIDWNGEFTRILEQSPSGDILFSPYEIYIRTLYELFKEELEDDIQISQSRNGLELHEFQKKNVQALLRRLNKYRFAMLSDSVGLGKTVTAAEVIRHYIDSDEGKKRVVIITPKSIKEQWTKELTLWGIPNLVPIVLQNPGEIERTKELDTIAGVSLFVIDESHNLRNSAGKRFEQIITWLKQNPKAHVLMLTATPINNQLSDISNQILLGSRGYSDIFRFAMNVKQTKQTINVPFNKAIEQLVKNIKEDAKKGNPIDFEEIKRIMAPIIRTFVVRRTRQGIEKEYGGLMQNGDFKKFPKSIPESSKYEYPKDVADLIRNINSTDLPLSQIYNSKPESVIEDCRTLLHPLRQLNKVKSFMAEKDLLEESPTYFIYQLVLMLGFIPYRYQMYRTKYYGKEIEDIFEMKLNPEESKTLQLQLGLYGIFRTIFLKRLESSVEAFRKSLQSYSKKLSVFKDGVKLDKIISIKDIESAEAMIKLKMEFEEESEDETIEEEDTDTVKDTINSTNYEKERLLEDIEKEEKIIEVLNNQIDILGQNDAKLTRFTQLIEELKLKGLAGGKVLIFSYFADTVEYLENTLSAKSSVNNTSNTAFVSSRNRQDAEKIAGRFSPISKKYTIDSNETELNYLITTDVLSEGQNLQDCGVIVNYDLHWNPVRMIQRNGRINRLGSQFDKVYVYNLAPESKLESYLHLVQRLEGKINLIKYTIGTDQSVLSEAINPMEFTDTLEDIYSTDEIKRQKALEKAEEAADFLLSEDDYVLDLKRFKNDKDFTEYYKNEVFTISKNKWAVMPKKEVPNLPEVTSLVRLSSRDKFVDHQFVSMARDGDLFRSQTKLQVLEWLKTSRENNNRSEDRISIDRQDIHDVVLKKTLSYHEIDEEKPPTKTELEVLRIMSETQYTQNDISSVMKGFQSRNAYDLKKIRVLTKNISRLKRENKPYNDVLKELLSICKSTINDPDQPIKPDKVESILFYAKHNS
jgi:ERCC4-related helicase